MLSKPQIIFLHGALKQTGLDDEQWRLVLRNVGKVKAPFGVTPSSKNLSNEGFEDVMAFLEEKGFRDSKPGRAGDYWRQKAAARGQFADSRQVYRITMLAETCRYCLPAMCERVSGNRTQVPEKLTPREAHNLIEALKAVSRREATRDAAGSYARMTNDQLGMLIDQHNVTEDLFDGIPV